MNSVVMIRTVFRTVVTFLAAEEEEAVAGVVVDMPTERLAWTPDLLNRLSLLSIPPLLLVHA
jgi:hypothetical protein